NALRNLHQIAKSIIISLPIHNTSVWLLLLLLIRSNFFEVANKKGELFMSTISRHRWRIGIPGVLILLALLVSLAFTFSSRAFSHAAIAGSHVISVDPFHNKSSQHQTEVEPDSFAFGHTVVTTMQQV